MDQFQNRRRNYYIDKKFQTYFILKFCVLVLVGSFISGFIIYAMSKSTVTTTFVNSRLAIQSTADYILPAVFLASLVVIAIIGIATIAVTLFTSHKIAGPLYRMDKDLQEVMNGNLKLRFNLRIGDEIKPLAASLDLMTQTLRARIDEMKKCVGELESRALNTELKEKLAKLKEHLGKFTT